MKNRFWNFLKAFGAFSVIMVVLALGVVGLVSFFAPAIVPDWMYTVSGILSIPFVIAFFVVVFRERRSQRRAKKSKMNK